MAHDYAILGVDKHHCPSFPAFNRVVPFEELQQAWETEIEPNVRTGIRAQLEQNFGCYQFIPYMLTAAVVAGKLFIHAYERGKGVGEARLAGDWSLAIGGHCELTEGVYNETQELNAMGSILLTMQKEFSEEALCRYENAVTTLRADRFSVLGIITDDRRPVDQVHLGVVLLHALTEAEVQHYGMNEAALIDLGFKDIEELAGERERFEQWSKNLIDYVGENYLEVLAQVYCLTGVCGDMAIPACALDEAQDTAQFL